MLKKARNTYFRLLDELSNYTGDSKEYLHTYWKNRCFKFLNENPENFIKESEEITTRNLSEKGWETFCEEFKHFYNDITNQK